MGSKEIDQLSYREGFVFIGTIGGKSVPLEKRGSCNPKAKNASVFIHKIIPILINEETCPEVEKFLLTQDEQLDLDQIKANYIRKAEEEEDEN